MSFDFNSEKPIYVQLAEFIEDAVMSGAFAQGSQVPSTTEISVMYKINPATALKGINILVDEGILFKKRGVGMFVTEGAANVIKDKRQESFYNSFVKSMLDEAQKLGLTKEDIIKMIERN